VRRRAADARDRPLPDGGAGAGDVRRALARACPQRGAGRAHGDPRAQPRGAHLRAGGAERGAVAQPRAQRLRAGERPHHAQRQRRKAAGRRARAAGLSGDVANAIRDAHFAGGPIVTVSLPTPATSHSSLSPGTVAATPDGVPVMITSPAASSTISDSLLMTSGTFQIICAR